MRYRGDARRTAGRRGRDRVLRMLEGVSTGYAAALYSAAIQVGVVATSEDADERAKAREAASKGVVLDEVPVAPWLEGTGSAREFYDCFLAVSPFLDRLDDACVLSPYARRAKWRDEERRAEACAEEHSRQSRRMVASREARLADREKNRSAFEATIAAGTRAAGAEWSEVIWSDLAALRRKPPCFWFAVSFVGLDEVTARAVLHRVALFEEAHGNLLPPAFKVSCGDVMLRFSRHVDVDEAPPSARCTRSGWYRKIVGIFGTGSARRPSIRRSTPSPARAEGGGERAAGS